MSFEKIYGYDHIKKELNVIIDILNNTEKYTKAGAKIPAGVLFHGAPGLGKTLFANEFMDSLTNRNKYVIRKNKPDGEFVNYISDKVTEAIKNAPSVVLFDDMDKFANDDDNHKNSEEFVTVQSLIDDAKDKNVFFIATTNSLRYIPNSLLRDGRFNYEYHLDFPKLDDSKEIIEHYLKNKNLADDIDYKEIAKLLNGRSCATLEKVMNEAAILCTYKDKNIIDRDDIITAILRIVYDGPECDDENEYAKKVAAYHEAGHTLVSEVLDNGSVDLVSIGNYFSDKGGLTSITATEDYWQKIEEMENRVRVLLAGKAATELYLGMIDLGCSSDLDRATSVVKRFFIDYCAYNFDNSTIGASHYYLNQSEALCENVEKDISKALDKYYQETRKILSEHRDEYFKIVELLTEKKVITQRELQPIFA